MDDHLIAMYQRRAMWKSLALLVILTGCPPPRHYAIDRPGLPCDRAARVARNTFVALGYTVTELAEPSLERTGMIGGAKVAADGSTVSGRVLIRCTPQGALLQPVETSMVPENYEFSRAFGYSFKSLVQRPEVEQPWKSAGLQVLVQALDPFEARLDLDGVPTVGDAVPVRVTVRNDTARAVRLDVGRLSLVDVGGASRPPLTGAALAAALAGNAAGARVRAELFDTKAIAAHATRIGFLVYPPGAYKEARVAVEDVETEETEGFVTPVE